MSSPQVPAEYSVVRGASVSELNRNMRLALMDGFGPQGGIFVLQVGDGYMYHQAVVKYDEEFDPMK